MTRGLIAGQEVLGVSPECSPVRVREPMVPGKEGLKASSVVPKECAVSSLPFVLVCPKLPLHVVHD